MQLLVFTSTPPLKEYAYVRDAEDYGRRYVTPFLRASSMNPERSDMWLHALGNGFICR